MVRHIALLLLLLMAMPAWAQQHMTGSDGFYAQLSDTHIEEGNLVTLKVILRGHNAQKEPDLRSIDTTFTLTGQSVKEQISIMQGQYQRIVEWEYKLLPKRTGRLTIPSIWIQTDVGTLRTDPMHVSVSKVGSLGPKTSPKQQRAVTAQQNDGQNIYAEWLLPSPAPYVGQPALAVLRIWTSRNVVDVQLGQAAVDGAKIEPLGEPQSLDVRHNGVIMQRTDIRYLLTPISEEPVQLKPIAMEANIISRGRLPSASDLLRQGKNPFDVFNQMMRGMGGIEAKEFLTPARTIDPLPIPYHWPGDASDWLPLTALDVSQKVEVGTAEVGQPVIRTITMIGQSTYPEQLPNIERYHADAISGTAWQQYPDKKKDDFMLRESPAGVRSWQIQRITLIPTDNGEQTLPELRIPWWDVVKQELRYATVPAYPVVIEGEPITPTKAPPITMGEREAPLSETPMPEPLLPTLIAGWIAIKPWLPAIVGVLVVLIVAAMIAWCGKAARPQKETAQAEANAALGRIALSIACLRAKNAVKLSDMLQHHARHYPSLIMAQPCVERAAFAGEKTSLSTMKLRILRLLWWPPKAETEDRLPPLNSSV